MVGIGINSEKEKEKRKFLRRGDRKRSQTTGKGSSSLRRVKVAVLSINRDDMLVIYKIAR